MTIWRVVAITGARSGAIVTLSLGAATLAFVFGSTDHAQGAAVSPRTVAVTSAPISALVQDGNVLVWRTSPKDFTFFDPSKPGIVNRLRLNFISDRDACQRRLNRIDFVFAARRILFACNKSNRGLCATSRLGARRPPTRPHGSSASCSLSPPSPSMLC